MDRLRRAGLGILIAGAVSWFPSVLTFVFRTNPDNSPDDLGRAAIGSAATLIGVGIVLTVSNMLARNAGIQHYNDWANRNGCKNDPP